MIKWKEKGGSEYKPPYDGIKGSVRGEKRDMAAELPRLGPETRLESGNQKATA